MGNREKLVSMVRGTTQRTKIIFLRFDDDDQEVDEEFLDEEEVRKLTSSDYLFMFGTLPEDRERVIREERCLVKGPDGRFTAHNTDKQGSVYLVL